MQEGRQARGAGTWVATWGRADSLPGLVGVADEVGVCARPAPAALAGRRPLLAALIRLEVLRPPCSQADGLRARTQRRAMLKRGAALPWPPVLIKQCCKQSTHCGGQQQGH